MKGESKNGSIGRNYDINGSLTTNEEIELIKYRSLWRAVIMQAILDLVNNSSRTEEKMAKDSAKSWIFGSSNDFTSICAIAEYDPSYIRRKAEKVISNFNVKNKKWKILLNKKLYSDI